MIGNRCLLDTNAIIQVFKNKNNVADLLDKIQEVYVPATVIGELKFGAYYSVNTQKHLDQINEFLTNCITLQIDSFTADPYGIIKANLAKKGKPIPENDIWIAAIAILHNLPLFTNDAHFSEIDTVKLFNI
jgi:tRNA(fMet)-specific endonuclease VapC